MAHLNDSKVENQVFSDSDDEDDPIKSEVTLRIQESTNVILRTFRTFLSEPKFINNTGDESTNIVDRTYKKCYNIPPKNVSKFFKYLDACRRKNLRMSMYEKQLEYSGIMLDFDIFQEENHSQLTRDQFHRLCIAVIQILVKYLDFGDAENIEIVVGFTRKPKVAPVGDEEGKYKDGFHMLIPGIQVTRAFKKLLINQMIKDEIMDRVFHDMNPHSDYKRSDFIDVNSAFVGVHFIGSATKAGKPPYKMTNVFKVKVNIHHKDFIPQSYDAMIEQAQESVNTNLCYEFSLNWQKKTEKGGIIIKKKYDVKSEYEAQISALQSKKSEMEDADEFEQDSVHGEMSLLNVHDPNAMYIKSLLDILHIDRATEYDLWFQVLCVLAHASEAYKPLGEYFSRRVPESFDLVGFEKSWESAVRDTRNNLTLGSLHYWAQQDNPDRYEEVRQRSVYTTLYRKIYDIQTEGILEHYDIAELLHKMLKHKYVYDREEGDPIGCWHEFIIDSEPQCKGEMFKWRKYDTRKPSSLMRYMSEVLPKLFRRVLDRIKATYEESTGDLAKYHGQILKNFQRTSRSLKNSGFKRGVINESEFIFENIGFARDLDTDPFLKGVGNGVLMLGKISKLITGYHGHKVSKFTPIDFKRMNPEDPKTRKLLIALRNLFPNCEPDTFNYIMHYLASTLDGKKKESIMLLLVGAGSNGKSFLVELHKGAIGAIYGVKMPISFLTTKVKDSESATPALMQLKDAHFAYYSESNQCEILNVAKIKEFTGQETLAGRKLHHDYVNFKPKCHHLVTSNNDFEVPGTDHGTWRRLKYLRMKIKFCDPAVDDYDPKNPFERLGDPEIGSEWSEDPEILSIYLGIMVYYYESLQKNYGGKVQNVPHPNIKKETEDFRNRQDTLNNFINMFLVKCEDERQETPIGDVMEKYIIWFQAMYPDNKSFKKGLVDQIENSVLQKFSTKSRRGRFLVGYRILGQSEEKEEEETYYSDSRHESKENKVEIQEETSEDFYERIRKAVAEDQPLTPTKKKKLLQKPKLVSDSDSDSDIDYDAEKVESSRPKIKKKNQKNFSPKKETSRDKVTGLAAPKKRNVTTPKKGTLKSDSPPRGKKVDKQMALSILGNLTDNEDSGSDCEEESDQ
jgi:hypothetical protein